jgi:hypothetical protein
MRLVSILLFYMSRVAFRRAAQKRLIACFSGKSAEIWRSTLRLQSQLAAARPRHSSGVNLLVRYLEWDRALYQAAQEHGLSRSKAGTLIEEINWEILGPVTAAPVIEYVGSTRCIARVEPRYAREFITRRRSRRLIAESNSC